MGRDACIDFDVPLAAEPRLRAPHMHTHSHALRSISCSTALAFFFAGGLCAAPIPSPFADVIVVDGDGGPGSDFTDLTSAVFAAQDGDTLIVDGGGALDVYGSAFVIGKSLTIVGRPNAAGERPRIEGVLQFHDLPSGGSIVVRGIDVVSVAPGFFALQVFACNGAVLVEDVRLTGPSVLPGESEARAALAVFDSPAVHFVRVDAHAAAAGAAVDGGSAAQFSGSWVAMHACVMRAGDGFSAGAGNSATNGGVAVRQFDGTLLVANSLVRGGDGGAAFDSGSGCGPGGVGGAALEVVEQTSALALTWHVDSQLVGGATLASPTCPSGPAVEPIHVTTAGVEELAGEVPSLVAPALATFGSPFQLELEGPAGALAFLGVSPLPRFHPQLPLAGVLAIEPRYGILEVGPLSTSGTAKFVGELPDIGLSALSVVIQVATADLSTGIATLGTPSVVTLLPR
jgi:hypothetical protein